jgi:hypothetical protein
MKRLSLLVYIDDIADVPILNELFSDEGVCAVVSH